MEQAQRESGGGIVKGPDGRVVIVRQHGNSWSFPKGHLEPNEDVRTAAQREIEEETGITDLMYVRDLGSYERYSIGPDGMGENKEWGLKKITFFLYTTPQHALHPRADGEISEARYVTRDEAFEMLTHPRDREFLKSVWDTIGE
jgi:8-oxo-dGTP pyrophosphatase MutT (NUDIX family)